MNIELVVFDLAGTTVKDNQDVPRVLKNAMAKHGIEMTLHEASQLMGIPKPVAIRKILNRHRQVISESLVKEIHKDFVTEMIAFYKNDSSVGEITGVSEMFRKLKSHNIKIAVDTGFDRSITKPLLQRLGWIENNLIDASVTSDEVERGRPYPDMIYRSMEIVNVEDVAKVAKVGDTAYDLEEGVAAGCGLVVGVTSGAFSKQDLEKQCHTHLIETAQGILDILKIN